MTSDFLKVTPKVAFRVTSGPRKSHFSHLLSYFRFFGVSGVLGFTTHGSVNRRFQSVVRCFWPSRVIVGANEFGTNFSF